MNPGRELDARVAQEVMGWQPGPNGWEEGGTLHRVIIPYGWSPSRDTTEANCVLVKISGSISIRGSSWVVVVAGAKDPIVVNNAESMAHAICLAALEAVGGAVKPRP